MIIVLVFSLGLGVLRSGSTTWAGGVYLLTYAVLLLAIVGAVCRSGAERPGWLGFALFGFAYFRYVYGFEFRGIRLPTLRLLDLIRPAGIGPDARFEDAPSICFWLVGHCLWSLVVALLGGVFALGVMPRDRPAGPVVEPRPEARPARAGWRRAAATGLTLLIPFAPLVLVDPFANPALWASTLYLATWVVLGITALGCVCGHGKRRLVWLGAALFGLGYMTLNRRGDDFEATSYVHLVADEFLEAIRPVFPDVVRGFPAKTLAMARDNARIKQTLGRKIPLRFRDGTTLGNLLNYLRATTKAADGRELPIYLDPKGLADVDNTEDSVIRIDLEATSLGTTLRLALEQINLTFAVSDGMVLITSDLPDNLPPENDYYLLVGHSVLALLAAGLGAVLVPIVAAQEA